MLNKLVLREIRSMLERHWTTLEIAHKLCIPIGEVESAVKSLAH